MAIQTTVFEEKWLEKESENKKNCVKNLQKQVLIE